MRPPVVVNGVTVQAGERRVIDLPIARLYTHTAMTMPVHVIHGRKDGPRLFVSAAIHGDEINGVEIVRRLLSLKLISKLRGTLLAIPIVNAFGFINCSRYLPDRRDLNRSFPGSNKGSLTSHLARLFMEEIVDKCTHGIDIHTGSNHRINLPQLRVSLDSPGLEELARAFGAPVIINARLRDNSLREAVIEKGIPMLLYEAGEALRFNEHAIQVGVRGVIDVMREIGMLPRSTKKRKREESIIVQSTIWVRSPKSGIMRSSAPLGAKIDQGQVIAKIVDPFGEQEENVTAPLDGIIIGSLKLPLVYKGDALFHVAPLKHMEGIEKLNGFILEDEFHVKSLR